MVTACFTSPTKHPARNFIRCAVISLALPFTANGMASKVMAEPLHVNVLNDSVLPGEPIVVGFRFRSDVIDEGKEYGKDPDRRRYARSPWLSAELRSSNGQMIRLPRIRIPVTADAMETEVLQGNQVILLCLPSRSDDEPARFLEPGSYTLQFVEQHEGSIRSDSTGLTIRAPTGEEQEALRLVESLTLAEFASVLLLFKGEEASVALFEQLAANYAETVHGILARRALAMRRFKNTFEAHNNKGGADVWLPVSEVLRRAAADAKAMPVLLEDTLFALARAHAFAEQHQKAEQTAARLGREFPHGEHGSRAAEFAAELTEYQRKQNRTNR